MHAETLSAAGEVAPREVALETVAACDLCGGRDFEPRRVWRDMLLFGPERWTLVRCKTCALHFINPRPTREAIGGFYPQDYAAHLAPPKPPKPWHHRVSAKDAPPLAWWERRWFQIRQDVSWYRMPAWHGDGHVLDIGCGSGGRYLDPLKGLGWTTYGVEPSAQAVAHAVANGHNAVVGNAEDQHFPDQSMDVVTMWHVLEHTHSPRQALATCFRMLKPGGQLSLCVPNWHSLQAAWQRRFWWSCDAPRHLYQFTRATLKRYLADAGFEVVSVRTRTGSTSRQRFARHFLNAVFGTKWSKDSAFLVDALDPLCALGSLVGFGGVGSELRVIAARPR